MSTVITAGNATNGLSLSADNAGAFEFKTGTGAGTTAMTINSSQNVGIGATTVGAKLHVSQVNTTVGALFNGTTRAIRFGFDTTGSIIEGVDNTGVTSFQPLSVGGSDVRFTTSGTERMRITDNGALCIGATSFGAVGISLSSPSVSGYYSTSSVTTATLHSRFANPNGAVGSITTNGTATAYATSSDYRLKENVQPMVGALDKISQLKPCTYTWKADGSNGEGFIAHELQSVVPDAVIGEKDAIDAEGNPVYQGIDTSFLVATLTAAIQELSAKVAALEAR